MADRPILTAELLSIGTELTVGDTRDTNAGDLAFSLASIGVVVGRILAVPDDLDTVLESFRAAVARTDLVVSTGGLGPTPDDLTREAIAGAIGETPAVDAELERWLRGLWTRRAMPFPEMNLKQAWLVPSATPLPNPNGTAPGWWVDLPDRRVIVAMPGPPREMRPMWANEVLPRLARRGAGASIASRTLRLAGIGESQVAEILGEDLLRADDPLVATYARSDAVDVRISSRGDPGGARSAAGIVEEVHDRIAELLAGHIWAEGSTTWAEAIGAALGRGSLAIAEVATGGSLGALLGDRDWLAFTESMAATTSTARAHARSSGLERLARRVRELGETTHGAAVRARSRGADTAVSVAVVGPDWVRRERRLVFLGGANGRTRAALAAADILLAALRAT